MEILWITLSVVVIISALGFWMERVVQAKRIQKEAMVTHIFKVTEATLRNLYTFFIEEEVTKKKPEPSD